MRVRLTSEHIFAILRVRTQVRKYESRENTKMNEYENTYFQLDALTDTEQEFIRLLRCCGEEAVNRALISQEQRSAEIQEDF